jgi:predicted nucleic acid-binding protein
MKRMVVDASVVIARLLGETRPAIVDELLLDAAHGRTILIAPTLLWLEVGNRLSCPVSITDEQALDGMLRLETFGIQTVETGPPLRLRALQLAREKRLTMYDATYLAVAEATHAPLMTLDVQLERAAASMGLNRPGGLGRISEPEAEYGQAPTDHVSLAALGATLAELRKRYASS